MRNKHQLYILTKKNNKYAWHLHILELIISIPHSEQYGKDLFLKRVFPTKLIYSDCILYIYILRLLQDIESSVLCYTVYALFYLNRMFFTDIFLCIHKFQKKDALFCAIQCTLCLEEGLIHCRYSVNEELNAWW